MAYLVERTVGMDDCTVEANSFSGTDAFEAVNASDPADEWDASTTYSAGDLAFAYPTDMADSGLPIYYESITSSNTGNDPTLEDQDAGTNWLRGVPFLKERLFDRRLNAPLSKNSFATLPDAGFDAIRVTVNASGSPARPFFDTVWLGNIIGAESVQLVVTDDSSPAVTVYDQTIDLHDTNGIIDGWTWRTYDPDDFRLKQALFWDVPGWPEYTATITITASATNSAKLGEFFAGKRIKLGDTLQASEGGFQDYSETTARNAYGDVRLVQQGYARESRLRVAIDKSTQGFVQRLVERNRAKPQLWLADPALTNIEHVIFGFPSGAPRFPWSVGSKMFCTIPLTSVNQETNQ